MPELSRLLYRRRQSGAALVSLAVFVLLLLTAAYVFFYVIFGYTIPPGYIGVRQIKFGPWQGFSSQGLPPGAHWGVPAYSVVHFVPQTIQTIHFSSPHAARSELAGTPEAGKRAFSAAERQVQTQLGLNAHQSLPAASGQGIIFADFLGASQLGALEIQTSDRATVNVDLTVLSRFYAAPGKDGGIKHGGPAELLTSLRNDPNRWEERIRRTTEDELKRALAVLSTEEFYNPFLREKQVEAAHAAVNKGLAPYGIKVEALLVRRYTYKDERIDKAIFDKNLQNQEERLNLAASKLAEAHAALEQVAAEADARILTLRVEGENKARVIRSEGDLFENEKRAQGDLEVAKAKAEVDKLRAAALTSHPAGSIYVARELAQLLSSLKGGLVTELNPYDINQWTVNLGAEAEGQ